jgi:hypothetical protein
VYGVKLETRHLKLDHSKTPVSDFGSKISTIIGVKALPGLWGDFFMDEYMLTGHEQTPRKKVGEGYPSKCGG